MSPSIYFPQTSHSHGQRDRLYPFSNGTLPSAVTEKLHKRHFGPWILKRTFLLPTSRRRRLRVYYPNTGRLHYVAVARFGQSKGTLVFGLLLLLSTVLIIGGLMIGIKAAVRNDSTVVFRREELQRIWKWEIESGHYPSRREIPPDLLLKQEYNNPSLSRSKRLASGRPGAGVTATNPMGPKRRYLTPKNFTGSIEYPPRPFPGSVADLDIIMDHCDFSQKKYVRDCHEFLRAGSGLDNGIRFRRHDSEDMSYIYVEEADNSTAPFVVTPDHPDQSAITTAPLPEMKLKAGAQWEPPLKLQPPDPYRPYYDLPNPPCDPDSPRIFHMYWAGPFTDKPYMAILSFLFTQNTGLHLPRASVDNRVCRPQLWLWINPGSANSIPNQSVTREMFDSLKSNPWSAPWLHPRFKDVVSFKLWNTTEQLNGIPEIKDDWVKLTSLFNSGGHKYDVPIPLAEEEEGITATITRSRSKDEQRAGSQSASTYDKLSVIMSDIARFVLCHQYGGIYLDADTIFLRDWEELWGWKGAFAYRWSRLPKYNTAVLRMSKKSALGSFIFRTALKNDMDVHPFKLSVYAKQAMVEKLLLRLPDALFDPAWLNTEDYQLDRPAQPLFTTFLAFFDTPAPDNGSPSSLGFSSFFRGAFSYHFHNYWWKPFDPARNWPDLGLRFIAGERKARKEALGDGVQAQATIPDFDTVTKFADMLEDDKQDLDWATVLKRTFESYIRGERPNMYGESLQW